MNPGMYGMPSGSPQGVRKLKALGGSAVSVIGGGNVNSYATPCHATPVSGASTPANTRVRLMSIQDRGAVRFFGVVDPGRLVRIELFVDGVLVFDQSIGLLSTSALLLCVGFGSGAVNNTPSNPVAIPDYIPFDSSFEVFATMSTGGSTLDYLFNADLHQ